MDTRSGEGSKTVKLPFDDRGKAADKTKEMLRDTANSSSALMQIRDAETGDFVFVNTMKLSSVTVEEADRE